MSTEVAEQQVAGSTIFAVESYPFLACVRQTTHRNAAMSAIVERILEADGHGHPIETADTVRVVAIGESLVIEFDVGELMAEIGGIIEKRKKP